MNTCVIISYRSLSWLLCRWLLWRWLLPRDYKLRMGDAIRIFYEKIVIYYYIIYYLIIIAIKLFIWEKIVANPN